MSKALGCRASRRPWARWVACAVLLLPAMPSLAADQPPVRITGYGRYTVERDGPVQDLPPGATGVTSYAPSQGAQLVETTTRIEARLCNRFGIWFDLPYAVPGFPATVTIRLTHPLLVNPDGRRGTAETWPQVVGDASAAGGGGAGGGGAAGFSFDEPWEAAPGTWTFAVMSGTEVLAEQAFEVVAPTRPGTATPGRCNALTS